MQVARLCLRGSLPNFVSRNLNREQSIEVNQLTVDTIKDPEIAPSKHEFKMQLAKTIKGEYKDTPEAGDAELWVAAWRAVLTAMYYAPLEYRSLSDAVIDGKPSKNRGILRNNSVIEIGDLSIIASEELPIPSRQSVHICTHSDTSEVIINPRGLLVNPTINSKYVIIRDNAIIYGPATPDKNSHRTMITGDFVSASIEIGDIVRIIGGPGNGTESVIDEIADSYIYIGRPTPLIIGSDLNAMVRAVKRMSDSYSNAQGKPKYEVIPGLAPAHMIIRSRRTNPSIIFDNLQMRKLVKNYIWEFFGQILKENKRPITKVSKIMRDHAESVAMRLIMSALSDGKESVKFELCDNLIKTDTNLMSMSIVRHIAQLKHEFKQHNVDIQVNDDEGIRIKTIGATPIVSKKIVEAKLHQIQSLDQESDDNNTSVRDSIESKIADRSKIFDAESVVCNDSVCELLKSLPSRAIEYVNVIIDPPPQFTNEYGESTKRSDIARFLGISQNEAKKIIETIKLQMMALGIGPDSLRLQI